MGKGKFQKCDDLYVGGAFALAMPIITFACALAVVVAGSFYGVAHTKNADLEYASCLILNRTVLLAVAPNEEYRWFAEWTVNVTFFSGAPSTAETRKILSYNETTKKADAEKEALTLFEGDGPYFCYVAADPLSGKPTGVWQLLPEQPALVATIVFACVTFVLFIISVMIASKSRRRLFCSCCCRF